MTTRHSVAGGGGLALNVLEWGTPTGRPIVFVHGWSQTHLCWSRQVESALADEFRLIAFDLRGHGMSAAPTTSASYTDGRLWADDLHAVIKGLRLTRPLLVGWSYAGLVIADYLRAYGDADISGINFVAAAVRLDQAALGSLIGSSFGDLVGRAASVDLAVSIDAMREFIDRCFAVKLSRQDYERALCWNMTARPDVRASLAAREVAADDVLAALTVPVLMSHGRKDVLVLPAMGELILALCPHARASWYDEAAHAPFIEAAARFNEELAAFARELSA